MTIENSLYTLKEKLSFEHEYNQRCLQEFESLEKIQHDSNNHFNKTEFENIIEKIRLVFLLFKLQSKKKPLFLLVKIIRNIVKFNYRN
jgi:hypothetical protein